MKDDHRQLLPSWLVSLIGRVVHPYRRGQGSNPVQPWIFFRLSFRNCKSCVQYNCDDHRSSNSSLRSSRIWFSYIQNFKYIFFVHCYEEIFFSSQNTCKYTLWSKYLPSKGQAPPVKKKSSIAMSPVIPFPTMPLQTLPVKTWKDRPYNWLLTQN